MDTQGHRCGKPQAVLLSPGCCWGPRSCQPRSGSSSNSPSLSGKWVWENSLDPSTAWAGAAQLLLGLRKPRALPKQRGAGAQNPPPDTAHIFYKVCFYTEMLLQCQTFHILSKIETAAEFLARTHRLQLQLYFEFYKANNCHLKIASSITLIMGLRGVFWS